ncbi:MAG: hypothetical protein HC842_02125 [Cytophagales bacterium]|nr:hypothetical protein [Cytophagales bacterium]
MRYRLAEGVDMARLLVLDINGKTLESHPISRARGQLALDLSGHGPGLYYLSCVVDGTPGEPLRIVQQ